MPDWSKSMQQTFEYYLVNPDTWKDEKQLRNVISSKITRDDSTETLESATIDITDGIDECYIRIYLVTNQNGIKEKFPLGTFLVQTPSISYDGKVTTVSLDAYSPLIELKEKPTPLGYTILKSYKIMENANQIVRENARAPLIPSADVQTLYSDFVASTSDTWLSYVSDLVSNAKFILGLDELGRILFNPKQETSSLQPVWTYNDDNSSILLQDITVDRDLYGVPNVVEVIYSKGSTYYYAKAVNDDENSPLSTVSRGREITLRVTDPSFVGNPTQNQIKEYAEQLLKSKSTVEYTVTYTHAYCPVRTGQCIRLNYKRAGINDIKAKVTKQVIDCISGCTVTETATFTTKLWR